MSIPSPTAKATGSTSTIAPAPKSRQVREVAEEIDRLVGRLVEYADVPATEPGLQLSPLYCRRLEETTGIGTTRFVEDFVKAVERLASIKIGDIRLPFTPGQLVELQYRATKRGRTVEQEMQAVVARIQDEVFHKGG